MKELLATIQSELSLFWFFEPALLELILTMRSKPLLKSTYTLPASIFLATLYAIEISDYNQVSFASLFDGI
jgi:hypothetical protein